MHVVSYNSFALTFLHRDSAIPYEDIADALQTSKAVYDDKLSINSLVPYTAYHIKKVYQVGNKSPF